MSRFNDQRAERKWLRVAGTLALGLAMWYFAAHAVVAQVNILGQWRTLPNLMPINPVHMALLNNGKVLIVAGSGNVATETNFRAAVWDPQANTIVTQPVTWDMFCNGMVVLPDGRVFVNGGTLQYDPFHGELRNSAYDPATGLFTDLQSMAHGRWYPTVTTLADGSVMTYSGLTETGGTNTTVEIYTPGSGWSQQYSGSWTPPLYPRLHLLPNGTVFYSGSGQGSRIFNPSTTAWSAVVASTRYSGTRTYGTSVLLPLSPSNGYRARVMIMGGGNPATPTTEIIEPLAAGAAWQYGPPMAQSRIEMNATILPNGKVLTMGGSSNDEDAATASLKAEVYDPATNTFGSAGANVYPRLYHSGSLLLPDATVLLAGGNPTRGSYESHMEIYSPAYLFDAVGQPAVRPVISGVSPGVFSHGDTFQISTPDAASITSVVLVRPGAPTHAFDMDQRLVELSYSTGGGLLTATAPPNGGIAPPGYYLLFVLNSSGVPSTARFIRLTAPLPNQAPTATITSPDTNITVNAGQSAFFSGSGSDPDGSVAAYAWTFAGGSPSSSSLASPGNVTYPAPGPYTASLTVTDNKGLASQPATRTITVPDFSLAATPASQTVLPAGGTSYTVTATGAPGFSGSIGFSVSGLPSGAAASFSPTSIDSSGSTTLSVSTAASTPTGTYPLTITGTTGVITHTVNVTLVVAGDFSISVSPTSRTIARGSSGAYTVAITAGPGLPGTVNLSVSGMPKFATGTFAPASVVNSGTSTLTIDTKKQVGRSSYTLTVTATSSGRTHSATATLIIQ